MGITDAEIARINELYHKSKESGLSEEEKAEQYELRQKYIGSIKANLSANLGSIRVVDEHGNIKELKKKNVQ